MKYQENLHILWILRQPIWSLMPIENNSKIMKCPLIININYHIAKNDLAISIETLLGFEKTILEGEAIFESSIIVNNLSSNSLQHYYSIIEDSCLNYERQPIIYSFLL